MPNPGDMAPYGEDYIVRRIDDVERKIKEGFAARSLAASQIGSGGELLIDGSLRVTGSIAVPGTLATAGALTAGTTVTAGGKITAGAGVDANGAITGTSLAVGSGAISGGAITGTSLGVGSGAISGGAISGSTVNASGTLYAGGTSNLAGQITSPGTRGSISSGNILYISAAGVIGLPVSSERYKTDIVDAFIDINAVEALRLVEFRSKQEIEEQGDSAPKLLGLIAEEVDNLGLNYLVRYENGIVESVNYGQLALHLLPLVQSQAARITALEARLTAAGL